MSIQTKKHRLDNSVYIGQKTVSFTACVEQRQRAFIDSTIVSAMVDILGSSCQKFSCIVPVYCFMPDHVHILIQGSKESSRIKAAMDSFKARSGLWFNTSRTNIRWHSDYHDRVIRDARELLNLAQYIVANPIRAGLAREWDEYPFTGSIGVELANFLFDASVDSEFA